MKENHVDFLTAVKDITAGNAKIKKSEVSASGVLPVIDQGKNLISGFVSNPRFAVKRKCPVIVFGDHTRTFKYLDFDFAIGADGTKILEPQQGFLPKYLYRYFESINLPNLGYSRHFKALKEVLVPKPPLVEQRRITAILDQADAIRGQRQKAVKQINSLPLSLFYTLITSESNGSKIPLGNLGNWRSGATPPRSVSKYFTGDIPWVTSGELGDIYVREARESLSLSAFEETSAKVVPPGSLMVGMYDTAALKSSIAVRELSCNQAVAFSLLDAQKVDPLYAYFAIQNSKKQTLNLRRGIRQKNLNLSMIRSVEIPMVARNLQDIFAARTQGILKQQRAMQRALDRDNELFASLQSRAFRGEL